MIKAYVSIIFTCVSLSIVAQTDRIITTKYDTLYGRVRISLPDGPVDEVSIKYKKGKKNKRKLYKANEVLSIIHEGETFKTVRHASGYYFMKPVIEGYLSYYKYRPRDQSYYSQDYLYKKNGEGLDISLILFNNQISKFLSDCNAIKENANNKKYNFNELQKIVIDYNDCKGSGMEIKDELLSSRTRKNGEESAPMIQVRRSVHDILSDINREAGKLEIEKLADLQELIKDLRRKIANGEEIPSYMVEAFSEYAYLSPEMKSLVSDLKARYN
ncbi:MAG TPA: hypothetical protein ACFCUD_03990 [Cyclobacteriaceae bacterium]